MSSSATSPGEDRQVLILINPKAGARSSQGIVDGLSEALTARGFVVQAFSDKDELAAEARLLEDRGKLRVVVAAGGDGTISLVANLTRPSTPIVPLPLGTENLLAKYLQIPPKAESVAEVIAEGERIQLDAGEADGRLFLLMAGCGFDADVVRRVHGQRKGHIHHWSYAKPILDTIRNYQYPSLRVRYRVADVRVHDGEAPAAVRAEDAPAEDAPAEDAMGEINAKWVFVVNLPRYAGGLSFVPDASGTDGQLDVCTFKDGSLWKGLWYLGGVVLGQHRNLNDCVTCQSTSVTIEADGDAEVPYQLDGDPGGFLPVEIRVIPQRLNLLVPRFWKQARAST